MSFTCSVLKKEDQNIWPQGLRDSRGVIKTAVTLTHKADEPTNQKTVPRNRIFWVWKTSKRDKGGSRNHKEEGWDVGVGGRGGTRSTMGRNSCVLAAQRAEQNPDALQP